jgi:polyhydroxyalkanoate synthesis regulator phasin
MLPFPAATDVMQKQEAGMAVKQRGSSTNVDRMRAGSSMPADVIASVDDLMTAAQAAAAPVTKKARRRIQELGRQLDTARATEAKRLRQSAKARLKVEKRERQAADAAAAMASIVSTIRDEAGAAIGRKAGATAAKALAKPAAAKPAAAKPADAKSATPRSKPPVPPTKRATRAGTTTPRSTKPKPTA